MVDDQQGISKSPGVGERAIHPSTERHYTVGEVAEMWNLSHNVIAKMFRDEPGVLHVSIGRVMRRARQREHLRIPESVLRRVHEIWSRSRSTKVR